MKRWDNLIIVTLSFCLYLVAEQLNCEELSAITSDFASKTIAAVPQGATEGSSLFHTAIGAP